MLGLRAPKDDFQK
jgi:hypothetical protein